MLKDIEPFKLPIALGGEEYFLRYNLNSRLYLETLCPELIEKPTHEWTIDETLHYLRALLIDSRYAENKEHIEQRQFDKCIPTLSELGGAVDETILDDIVMQIMTAVENCLPSVVIDEGNFLTGGQVVK